MKFPFTFRVVVHGHPVGNPIENCVAFIEPDRVDGGWYPDVLLVDDYPIPDTHPFYDALFEFVMRHRPRIDAMWAERQRQRVLDPESV